MNGLFTTKWLSTINNLVVISTFIGMTTASAQSTVLEIDARDNNKELRFVLKKQEGFQLRPFSLPEGTGQEQRLYRVELVLEKPIIAVMNNRPFFLGSTDSIRFTFDKEKQQFVITGARYGSNQKILEYLNRETIFHGTSKFTGFTLNNLSDYRSEVVNNFKFQQHYLRSLYDQGTLSKDVWAYANQILANRHLIRLLNPLTNTVIDDFWPILFSPAESNRIYQQLRSEPFPEISEYAIATITFLQFKNQIHSNDNPLYRALWDIVSDFRGINREKLLDAFFTRSEMAHQIPRDSLKKILLLISQLDLDKDLMARIADKYNVLMTEGDVLPDVILLNTRILSVTGEKKTFKEVLDNLNGTGILVDFWASWCGPCIHALPKVKDIVAAREGLTDVVYLSVDENLSDWEISYTKNDIVNNQFLLLEGFDSELGRYLALEDIPRYIYLDKERKLKHLTILEELSRIFESEGL